MRMNNNRSPSPGPSWEALAEPIPSGSSASGSLMRSDIEMGDHDDEEDNESQLISSPKSFLAPKRKATDSLIPTKNPKIPRLSTSKSIRHDEPPGNASSSSRLPPPPRPNRKEVVTDSVRSSSSDSLDAPLTQQIIRLNRKEKSKEKAIKTVSGGRKVSNKSLLQQAQKSSGSGDSSSPAQTRVKRKGRRRLPSRVHPLPPSRPSHSKNVIELSDSDNGPRVIPSQPTRRATIASFEPIIITSDSEDAKIPGRRQTFAADARPLNVAGKSRTRKSSGPPPPDADVIVISDSEDDAPAAAPAGHTQERNDSPIPSPVRDNDDWNQGSPLIQTTTHNSDDFPAAASVNNSRAQERIDSPIPSPVRDSDDWDQGSPPIQATTHDMADFPVASPVNISRTQGQIDSSIPFSVRDSDDWGQGSPLIQATTHNMDDSPAAAPVNISRTQERNDSPVPDGDHWDRESPPIQAITHDSDDSPAVAPINISGTKDQNDSSIASVDNNDDWDQESPPIQATTHNSDDLQLRTSPIPAPADDDADNWKNDSPPLPSPRASTQPSAPIIPKPRVNLVKVVGESIFSSQFFARPLLPTLSRTQSQIDTVTPVSSSSGARSSSQLPQSQTPIDLAPKAPSRVPSPAVDSPMDDILSPGSEAGAVTSMDDDADINGDQARRPPTGPVADILDEATPVAEVAPPVSRPGPTQSPLPRAPRFPRLPSRFSSSSVPPSTPNPLLETVILPPVVPSPNSTSPSPALIPLPASIAASPAPTLSRISVPPPASAPAPKPPTALVAPLSSFPPATPRLSLADELNRVRLLKQAMYDNLQRKTTPVTNTPSTAIDLTLDEDESTPDEPSPVKSALPADSTSVSASSSSSLPNIDNIRDLTSKYRSSSKKSPLVVGPIPSPMPIVPSGQAQTPSQRRILKDRAAFLSTITPSPSNQASKSRKKPQTASSGSSAKSGNESEDKSSSLGSPQGKTKVGLGISSLQGLCDAPTKIIPMEIIPMEKDRGIEGSQSKDVTPLDNTDTGTRLNEGDEESLELQDLSTELGDIDLDYVNSSSSVAATPPKVPENLVDIAPSEGDVDISISAEVPAMDVFSSSDDVAMIEDILVEGTPAIDPASPTAADIGMIRNSTILLETTITEARVDILGDLSSQAAADSLQSADIPATSAPLLDADDVEVVRNPESLITAEATEGHIHMFSSQDPPDNSASAEIHAIDTVSFNAADDSGAAHSPPSPAAVALPEMNADPIQDPSSSAAITLSEITEDPVHTILVQPSVDNPEPAETPTINGIDSTSDDIETDQGPSDLPTVVLVEAPEVDDDDDDSVSSRAAVDNLVSRESPATDDLPFSPNIEMETGSESTTADDETQMALATASIPEVEHIGDYQIHTWAARTRERRRIEFQYLSAKDLEHSLNDYINNFPAEFHQSEQARLIFEALIADASDNEPHAPAIEIFDNNIGLETTPPWEFVYTNELWYGEDVPPPDIKNLKSCGCIGKCDPRSRTCACVKRQQTFLKPFAQDEQIPCTWEGANFLYDKKGKLQFHGYPIFECNEFCGCDDDCPNRVVQHGRECIVSINNTPDKGWGVFAGPKKIPKGTFVGIYSGELLTEKEADERGKFYNKFGRTYLFYIDFFYLEDEPEHFVVDAYHAGNFTRFLNHSCDPNCALEACYINEANMRKPLLAIFTTCDVEPYEELCFSYYGAPDEDEEDKPAPKTASGDAVYAICRCGSKRCRGQMF